MVADSTVVTRSKNHSRVDTLLCYFQDPFMNCQQVKTTHYWYLVRFLSCCWFHTQEFHIRLLHHHHFLVCWNHLHGQHYVMHFSFWHKTPHINVIFPKQHFRNHLYLQLITTKHHIWPDLLHQNRPKSYSHLKPTGYT